jgi:hypothetical protein
VPFFAFVAAVTAFSAAPLGSTAKVVLVNLAARKTGDVVSGVAPPPMPESGVVRLPNPSVRNSSCAAVLGPVAWGAKRTLTSQLPPTGMGLSVQVSPATR